MKDRDVGEMGESFLKAWAAQVGITANKASQDKRGWDFFLQFPSGCNTMPTLTLPLDKAVAPIECLLQVKSTDTCTEACAVKLSNWVRFVRSPYPAFFLVLEFAAQPNPQGAFLVHVDEHYIRRVLQRLRKISPTEQPDLHKKTMQFTYDASNALTALDGEGLAQAIRQYVGENPLTYVKKKLHFLQHAGYENEQAEVQFDVIVPKEHHSDAHGYLVDFALGLTPSLQIRNFTCWDARFGIRAHEPSDRITKTGALHIDQEPVGEYDLWLRTPDDRYQCHVRTQAYAPDSVRHLVSDTSLKVRCAAPYLDFIFWTHQPKFDIHCRFPALEDPHTLSELIPLARVLRFVHRACSQGGAVLVDLAAQGQPVLRGKGTISIPVSHSTLQVADALLHAWTICQSFALPDVREVRVAELLRHRERLATLALLLGPLPNMRVVTWVTSDIATTARQVCFPLVIDVTMGVYRIVVALALCGAPVPTRRNNGYGREYAVGINRVRIDRHYVFGQDEPLACSPQQLLQPIIDGCDQRHIDYILVE